MEKKLEIFYFKFLWGIFSACQIKNWAYYAITFAPGHQLK